MKEKLHQYIDNATGMELKNILSIAEEHSKTYILKKKYNHWKDKEFVKEMDRRMEEIKHPERYVIRKAYYRETLVKNFHSVKDKKKGQPLTLTLNLHMNLPYSFTILSVIL